MPRPQTRQDLISAAQTGFEKVSDFVDSLTPEERQSEFNFEDRDRNVRDVVAHLVEWHHMMQRWYTEGMAGEKPAVPAPGYTWKTTPELNQAIWQAAQKTSLEKALDDFRTSHGLIMELIESHTNDELFTKEFYPWTGTTSLGAYLISATSSHYDWAIKKLRKAKRTWQ